MLLLSLDEEEAHETLKGVELTADERDRLQGLYDRYEPVLGRIAHIFYDAYTRGLENTIDYVDISPRYVPNKQEIILDLKLYSGDSLAFHSIDSGAALLWLSQRLANTIANWLSWAEENELTINEEQTDRMQLSLQQLREAVEKLSSLKQLSRADPDQVP